MNPFSRSIKTKLLTPRRPEGHRKSSLTLRSQIRDWTIAAHSLLQLPFGSYWAWFNCRAELKHVDFNYFSLFFTGYVKVVKKTILTIFDVIFLACSAPWSSVNTFYTLQEMPCVCLYFYFIILFIYVFFTHITQNKSTNLMHH